MRLRQLCMTSLRPMAVEASASADDKKQSFNRLTSTSHQVLPVLPWVERISSSSVPQYLISTRCRDFRIGHRLGKRPIWNGPIIFSTDRRLDSVTTRANPNGFHRCISTSPPYGKNCEKAIQGRSFHCRSWLTIGPVAD